MRGLTTLLLLIFLLASPSFAERDVVVRPASAVMERPLAIKVETPPPISLAQEHEVEKPPIPPSMTIVYQEKARQKSFFEGILDKMLGKKK